DEEGRESDSVFRYGSDEFVILLQDVQHPQQPQHVAQKILNAVSATRHVAGHDLSIPARLDISIYPNDSGTAVELIKHAETAMHTSKERGSDRFSFYTDDMNHRAQHRQNLESAIRQALEREEFVLHY
ncbi:diguanylate cyclase domain-containing protein, partial [Pseudomonas viridiflava]|uniref:diguanylate cyclase domain-containing protein n=1 Tax=Pseudomonas viridiflava TaxID=33069 RepID=UPI000F061AA7